MHIKREMKKKNGTWKLIKYKVYNGLDSLYYAKMVFIL